MKNFKRILSLALALTLLAGAIPFAATPVSAATNTSLNQLASYLPLVTYAAPLTGASRVYSYSNSSLSSKTTGYYICTYSDQIVITQISSDGRAVYCTYPSSSSSTGYRSRWFAADDILGLSAVNVTAYTASSKSSTYRLNSSTSVKSYGSIAANDRCLRLGNRTVGSKTYYPTVYPISSTTVNRISGVKYKLALSTVGSSAPTSVPAASSSKTMTNALYGINISGSKLSCGFDGYVSLRQKYGYRHEGIDFAYGSGKNVYSLTDGVVTKVVKGSSGSLSTVAIYYAAADKTVVYLHLAPTISTGSTVRAGDKIGTESSRGAGGVVHTHVEVRDGYKTGAAVSKDTTLVNSDPTSFWNSLGYAVK